MTPIKLIREGDEWCQHDCERMIRVLAEHDLSATFEQVKEIWERYSETYAAGWLGLPDSDEELFSNMRRYFTFEE